MEKIECIQVGGMVCDEITAATVAKYFGRDYQCMFMECWNFFYNEHKENCLFGDNIGAVNYNKDKNLLQYHGIAKYCRRFDKPEQFVSSLIEMLENNKLVSCKFDQYYMPWALEKRKKEALRYNGYLLFYEYDCISKLFKCIDIHGDRKNRSISIENVRASAAGDTIDLKILNVYSCVNVCEPDYNYLFSLSVSNIYKENELNKTFLQSMCDANLQILKKFSMENEIDYTYKYVSQISDPTQVIFINSFVTNYNDTPLSLSLINANSSDSQDIQFSGIPNSEGNGYTAFITNYGVINKQCKNADKAYRLLKYIAGYKADYSSKLYMSVNKDIYSDKIEEISNATSWTMSSGKTYKLRRWDDETKIKFQYIIDNIKYVHINNTYIEDIISDSMNKYIDNTKDFDECYEDLLFKLNLYINE